MIPKQSEKRKKAIADGTWKPKPRKPIARKPFGKVLAGSPAASKLIARAFGKGKQGSRSKVMKEADKHFSEWIRLRDADEYGYILCVTSGKRMHWRDADCGHWISRAKLAVRYDERNAHAQGKMSNRFQGGHFFEHGLAIERIHGAGTRDILEKKVLQWEGTGAQMKTADFQFIANTYRERVAWIRQHEPGKFRSAA